MLSYGFLARSALVGLGLAGLLVLAVAGSSGLRQLASSKSWEAAFERQLSARQASNQLMIEPVSFSLPSGHGMAAVHEWTIGSGCEAQSNATSKFAAVICQRVFVGELQL